MGWNWGGAGNGAMSGASTGAMFGPWGAAIGGVGGGLMGGLKGGKEDEAPKVENFYGAATPSTNNPMGGQSWTQGPDGKWTSNYGFSGPAQGVWNNVMGGMGKAASYDPTQARNQAIQSNFDQGWSRLAPMQQQATQRLNSQAANMGLDPGQQAYQQNLGNLQRNQADQFNTLMSGAIRQGNETQAMQIEQMRQPFLQAGAMMNLLGQQGNNLDAPLRAAALTQKANDAAASRAASNNQGKKGGAGGLLGGAGGKKNKDGGSGGGRAGLPAGMGDYSVGGYGAGD